MRPRASNQALVDEERTMKDFSLLYGPVRTWLSVVAMAVLAMVVFVTQTTGSDGSCDPGDAVCAEPLFGERSR